jgi:hypothetical protein
MITLEEIAQRILNGLVKSDKQLLPDDVDFVVGQLRYVVNSRLEECAALCDEQGKDVVGEWYGNEDYRRGANACATAIRNTTAQTPAGLVRAMKVK